ncbi:conserved membrane hypothetical protein [Vibrio harveyi]|uniref:hypothetical protein n=1 Tax=Vibrio harveyi TaxID=669 RepID=UPI001EFCA3A0|nr:hypothetical protein [Vibrio harveyi]MCG9233662.1 hypothetical protein [Vibrio harveyi]MCG9586506.1 hypothetical protein [Vibrio harveyi]CAH1201492.1 conserved membrane hypothetical protein [Vibrio harveyi]CAH1547617.1 conserved membrane hypothetical protein [Vibrio harveyi]CAH1549125.1 conserved membrane hypothetical protein [Vibrio harveyi]
MKEYAPQYSKKEKIIRVVIACVFGLLAGVLFKLKGEPLLQALAEAPECYEVFGMQGLELLVHILFFWMPLSVFLLSAVLMLPLGVRGLIEGQFPPKGVKVFRPTAIQRGKLGTFKSLIHLLLPLLCFGFVVWGNGQIEPMMEIFQPKQGETTCID